MSLQVWLPLNGNIDNRGLASDFAFSNTASATVNSSGKIGSCYSFSTTTGNGIYSADNGFMDSYINGKSFTLCAWVKSTESDTTVISLSYGLRLIIGSNPYFSLYNSDRNVYCYSSVGTDDGNWHHVAGTYDNVTNDIKIYIDGVMTGSTSYTSGYTYSSSWANGLFIGRDPNNSTPNAHYYFQGSLNDIRVYDHCLSAEEIKEISRGLVIHYPLSDPYNEPTTNIDPAATAAPSFGGITTREKVNFMGKECWHIICSGTYCYREMHPTDLGYAVGDTLTMSCKLYIPSGQTSTGWYGLPYAFEYCSNVTSKTYDLTKLDTWQDCYCTATISGTNSNFLYYWIAYSTGGTIEFYITDMQFEAKDHATPYTSSSRNDTSVYDCTGYGHTGIITSSTSPAIYNDSPRYGASSYFIDNSKYIYSIVHMGGNSEVTLSYWFKSNTTGHSGYHIPLCMGTANYELSIDPYGGLRGGFVINGTRMIDDNGTVLLDGNWHMCTCTFNGSVIKRYIDGALVGSTNATGTLVSGDLELTIGRYGHDNTEYGNIQAYESDVRVYSTALSDDDILELYNTSAKVCKNGTLMCYEIKED